MTKFDPDELSLEKKDIIQLIEMIQKRWRKGGIKNAFYLAGLSAFKQGLKLVNDDILRLVWRDLVLLTNRMISYNGIKKMAGEMPKTAEMLKIIESEFDSGKFAGEPIK